MIVVNKEETIEAMQWFKNLQEIKEFMGYRNKDPLYTADGTQLNVRMHGMVSDRDYMYASHGDWLLKLNGRIVRVVSDEMFREKYVEI